MNALIVLVAAYCLALTFLVVVWWAVLAWSDRRHRARAFDPQGRRRL